MATFAKVMSRIELNTGSQADYNMAFKFFEKYAMTPSARAKLGMDWWRAERDGKTKPEGFRQFKK